MAGAGFQSVHYFRTWEMVGRVCWAIHHRHRHHTTQVTGRAPIAFGSWWATWEQPYWQLNVSIKFCRFLVKRLGERWPSQVLLAGLLCLISVPFYLWRFSLELVGSLINGLRHTFWRVSHFCVRVRVRMMAVISFSSLCCPWHIWYRRGWGHQPIWNPHRVSTVNRRIKYEKVYSAKSPLILLFHSLVTCYLSLFAGSVDNPQVVSTEAAGWCVSSRSYHAVSAHCHSHCHSQLSINVQCPFLPFPSLPPLPPRYADLVSIVVLLAGMEIYGRDPEPDV